MAIAIVISLSALLLVTMRGVLSSAKETRTQSTILKINTMLKQAEIEFDKAARRGDLPQLAGLKGVLTDEALKFVSYKLKYKYAFPQRIEDLVGFNGIAGTDADDADIAAPPSGFAGANIITSVPSPTPPPEYPYINSWMGRPDPSEFGAGLQCDDGAVGRLLQKRIAAGTFIPARHNPETESAEILYLMFSESSVYGVTTADAGDFSANELADTDNDGLLEFVDAWGNPLRFYRWPTRLINPETGIVDPADPTVNPYWDSLSNVKLKDLPAVYDQFDPTNTLTDQIRRLGISMGSTFFSEGKANTTLQNVIHTPNTYQTFLIVSAGEDGLLGLEEPTNAAELGHLGAPLKSIRDAVDAAATVTDKETIIYDSVLSDNITNLQLDTP